MSLHTIQPVEIDILPRTLVKGTKESGALFSLGKSYRYALWRQWDSEKPICSFICLNPSTADENQDDPTVRRCIDYAKQWDCGTFVMLNIFAFRATDPNVMKAHLRPEGTHNNIVISTYARQSMYAVAGWGNHGLHQERSERVEMLLNREGITLDALKVNANGQPAHPLYLKKDLSANTLDYLRNVHQGN